VNRPPLHVLGLGVVAVDDVVHVERYPAADDKQPVVREERVLGGLMGTALAAASRLGGQCAYLGVLGADELSLAARKGLDQAGVDVSLISTQEHAGPVHSVIVANDLTHTRAIFFNESLTVAPALSDIGADVVGLAKVLLVDHVHLSAAVAACRAARALGAPTVADIESAKAGELMALVDHLIVPRSFASAMTGSSEPIEMVRRLHGRGRRCTAVTCGSAGCYFQAGDGPAAHQKAFVVPQVETTGCGDVFHGSYALALAQGQDLARCIEFASAAAAVFASRPSGWRHLPQLAEVLALIDSQS